MELHFYTLFWSCFELFLLHVLWNEVSVVVRLDLCFKAIALPLINHHAFKTAFLIGLLFILTGYSSYSVLTLCKVKYLLFNSVIYNSSDILCYSVQFRYSVLILVHHLY